MQRLSITKGHAFILVYSVCSRQSLEEIRPIWHLIREIKGENLSSIPVMLGELVVALVCSVKIIDVWRLPSVNEIWYNSTDINWRLFISLCFLFLILILCLHSLCTAALLTVGNKIDESAELREVSNAEGQAQAAEWGVHFMETSAKTNHNVTELFEVRPRALCDTFSFNMLLFTRSPLFSRATNSTFDIQRVDFEASKCTTTCWIWFCKIDIRARASS